MLAGDQGWPIVSRTDLTLGAIEMSSNNDPEGRQAAEAIEVGACSAMRRATKSKFSWSFVPPELGRYGCLYENPNFGLQAGFDAFWIVERMPAEREGKVISAGVYTGAILVSGQLRQSIDESLRRREPRELTSDLMHDCHELLIEYMRYRAMRFFGTAVKPRIYEAEALRLNSYFLSDRWIVSPSAVSQSGAKQIF